MSRKVVYKREGYRTTDGAGVSLVRVLGNSTAKIYDPILMLDSFDSTNYDDYKAGFPMHPHRGIETISYIYKGKMRHRDSLGNGETISDGEVQWMTAGSGIKHEEFLPKSERLVGVQLWLNMPASKKMSKPDYKSLKTEDIPEIEFVGGKIRVLAGSYKDIQGYEGKYQPLDFYDIHLKGNSTITIDTPRDKSVMLFTLLGDSIISGKHVRAKTAVKLSQGESVTISGVGDYSHVLFISSSALNEEIAWGGPIVMNTQEELALAFTELREGTFIKSDIEY